MNPVRSSPAASLHSENARDDAPCSPAHASRGQNGTSFTSAKRQNNVHCGRREVASPLWLSFHPLALLWLLCACDSDRARPPLSLQHGADASVAEAFELVVPPADAGTCDAASLPPPLHDAGVIDTAVPNSPEITAVVGNTGRIELADDWIQGDFFADDTILRATSAPECVAFLRSGAKPRAAPGTLSVSSDLVGQPGGPLRAIDVGPGQDPPLGEYWHSVLDGCSSSAPTCPDDPLPGSPVLFRFPDGAQVRLQLQGSPAFAPLPVTTLRAPAFPSVEVLAPVPTATTTLGVRTTEPLRVRWAPPLDTSVPPTIAMSQRFIVELTLFSFVGQDVITESAIYCAWPLAAGQGIIPASLLQEVRDRLEVPQGDLAGAIAFHAGELEELIVGATSYVAFTHALISTSLVSSYNIGFD